MISKVKKKEMEADRDELADKKLKSKKLNKQFFKAFEKLNNERLYPYYTDTASITFQNMLNFFTYVDLKLKDYYGRKPKYNKSAVHYLMEFMFPEPTEAQVKTIEKLNKAMKKLKDSEYIENLHFKALLDGKYFFVNWEE
jgi:hypothetical protein